MPGQLEYQTVVLAALLHDIGKLLGRGSFALLDKGQHPKFSSEFVSAFSDVFSQVSDVSLLRELVQRHHESKQNFAEEFLVQNIKDAHTRTLAALVSKADNLSSSERGRSAEQYQDYKETPLASVLERVNRIGGESILLRYHPAPIGMPESMGTIFGADFATYEPGELNRHIKAFGEDFRSLFRDGTGGKVDTASFGCLVHHLTNVLHKYTWCIPSNTQEAIPDVSLYDHLKTTAAIASCLYTYHSKKGTLKESSVRRTDADRFCLVVGDMSGIQKYIFDIASIGVGGGIARRLRSRSLYVQLCAEVAAHLVLRRLDLPIAVHTIMNSGGRFYLLLPNLPEVVEAINEVQREADSWFLKELNGELALNLGHIEFGDSGFQAGEEGESGFGTILEKVNTTLNERKKNRFREALLVGKQWAEDSFKLDVYYEGADSCRSCRKFPIASGELCSHCELDRRIGADLPATRYLAFFDSPGAEIPVLGCSVSPWKSVPGDLKGKSPYLVMKLNEPDLSDVSRHPASSRYTAQFVASLDGCNVCREAQSHIATFECLARRSKGAELLGFLAADVDSLGKAFILGLKSETTSVDTVSRLTTFSRMLDQFFAGWVEHLTRESKDFYTIFSGGDDLLVVGPWDATIELAERVREDFARFTGNAELTLSAGVAIARHDFPVPSTAQAAKEALAQSKGRGRDRITLLGNTLPWGEWKKVKAEWLQLRPVVKDIPSTFLYNLLEFSEMWRRYIENKDTLGLRYHPLLAYSVSRNLDPRKTPVLYQWADKILSIRPGDKEQRTILNNLGLIAKLLVYSKRGGGK